MPKMRQFRKSIVSVRDMTPFEEEVFALAALIDEGCGADEKKEDEESQLEQWRDYQEELETAVDRVRWQFQLAQVNGPAVRESTMVI